MSKSIMSELLTIFLINFGEAKKGVPLHENMAKKFFKLYLPLLAPIWK